MARNFCPQDLSVSKLLRKSGGSARSKGLNKNDPPIARTTFQSEIVLPT